MSDRVREGGLVAADTLKALAQANPATAVVAGLVDMVQSR